MELGNHTWSHTSLPSVPAADAVSEVERTQAALVQRGVSTRLVRAPLGEATADQLAALVDARLRGIHWSVSVDHLVSERGLSPEAAAAAMREEIPSWIGWSDVPIVASHRPDRTIPLSETEQ